MWTKNKRKRRKEWNFSTRGAKEIQEHACLRVRCTVHLFPFLYMFESAHNKITWTVYIFKNQKCGTPYTRLECSRNRIKHTADRFISNTIVVVVCQFFFLIVFIFISCSSSLATQLLTHFNICIYCTITTTTYDKSARQTSLTLSSYAYCLYWLRFENGTKLENKRRNA